MEKRKNNIPYGIGDNAASLYDDESAAYKQHVENIKRDLHLVNRVRNRALISDLASGLVNLLARRKGSRVVLPTDATEKYNNALLQLNDKLHMAQRDYSGAIARKKVFAPSAASSAINPQPSSATQASVPKVSLLQPITSFAIRGNDAGNSIDRSRKIVERWRREKMLFPKWYSTKTDKNR